MAESYHGVLTPPGVLLQLSEFTCAGNNDRKVITARPEVNRVTL